MLTIKEYLVAAGLDVDLEKIKLVKLVDNKRYISIPEIIKQDKFDLFLAEQNRQKKVFHHCDVIVSFIGLENNLVKLWGVYRVSGHRDYTEQDYKNIKDVLLAHDNNLMKLIWYKLEELQKFRDLRQRLIVQWNPELDWVHSKDLDIYEILPPTLNSL